ITPCYDFYYTIPAPQRNGKCAITVLSALWLSVWLQRPWPVPGRYPKYFPCGMFLYLPTAQKSASGACRISAAPWPGCPPNRCTLTTSGCPPAPCTRRRGSESQPAAGRAASPGTAPVPRTFFHRAWYSILRWSSYPPLPCQLRNPPGRHILALIRGIVQQSLVLLIHVEQNIQLFQTGCFLRQLLLAGKWGSQFGACVFKLGLGFLQAVLLGLQAARQVLQRVVQAGDIAEHICAQRHRMGKRAFECDPVLVAPAIIGQHHGKAPVLPQTKG